MAIIIVATALTFASAQAATEAKPTFNAPAEPPTPDSDYSQAATNEFYQKVIDILNYGRLMNPKFLEDELGVKFTVFPNNYGPEKELSLSRFEFSGAKSDGTVKKMTVSYWIFVGSQTPATLNIYLLDRAVCLPEDAFDSFFQTPRHVPLIKSIGSDPNYFYERRAIDDHYGISFSFHVNESKKCISHIAMTQDQTQAFPFVPQPEPAYVK